MSLRAVTLVVISMGAIAASAQDKAEDGFRFQSAGVRYGFGEGSLARNFQEAEALADFTLPWKWDLGKSWEVKPRLGFSLGALGNDHRTAVVGSVGPMISLGPVDPPFAFDVGFSPTGLSEDNFVSRKVGGLFQIRSWFGLTWTFDRRLSIGYHFQHMSNAGLEKDNQGMNMHTFSVAYRF